MMKRMTDKRLARIEKEAGSAGPEEIRDFLRIKVGRRLLAILLGGRDLRNLRRADAYLYKKVRLEEPEMRKIDECYLAARIIDGLRDFDKGFDMNLARNWLMLSCLHLGDNAPICAIRDGRTYNHLSAIGAAKTFVLRQK